MPFLKERSSPAQFVLFYSHPEGDVMQRKEITVYYNGITKNCQPFSAGECTFLRTLMNTATALRNLSGFRGLFIHKKGG